MDWVSLYEFIYLLACNNIKSSMQYTKGQKYDLYVWEKSKTKIRKYRSTKGEKYKSIGQTVRLHQQERWSCACSCSPWLPWPMQRSPSSLSILKLTFPCSTVFNIIVIKIACCHDNHIICQVGLSKLDPSILQRPLPILNGEKIPGPLQVIHHGILISIFPS